MTNPDHLNERQRCYLLAAYAVDQQHEAMHKAAFQRGDDQESRRPASIWRAMPFGVTSGPGGAVPTLLKVECKGDVDEESGSTWAVLERRGLVRVQEREVQSFPGQFLPHVLLTSRGRQMARDLKKAPTRRAGEVSRSAWKALTAGWRAGEAGLWDDQGGDCYGGVSGDTWLLLTRRTKQRPAWFTDVQRPPAQGENECGVKITPEGQAKYWEAWEVNRAKYPDIDAPNPRMREHA